MPNTSDSDKLLKALRTIARKSPAYKTGEVGFDVKRIEPKLPFKGTELRRLLHGLSSTHEIEVSYHSRFGLDTLYMRKVKRAKRRRVE